MAAFKTVTLPTAADFLLSDAFPVNSTFMTTGENAVSSDAAMNPEWP